MKKMKVLLTAAAVVAVVGSGLAFKVNFGNGSLACRTDKGTCPSSLDYNTTTSGGSLLHCGASGSTTDCNTNTTTRVINVGE